MNDKTQEHIKQLEAKYSSLCKKINHLMHLANPSEDGVDKAKLKERVDKYIDKEMQDIIESYVSL